jgi:phage shock protein B
VAADHPDFRPLGRSASGDTDEPLSVLERQLAAKKGARS